jgi:Protein of unknown function (DUF995)
LTAVPADGRLNAFGFGGDPRVFRTKEIALVALMGFLIYASARADSLSKPDDSAPKQANSLPKTAIPMNSDMVKQIYSGKTAVWKDSDVYFAPDGSTKGLYGKPQIKALLEGSWSVTGNEICVYTYRTKDPNFYRDCYQYWLDKKRIVALWSEHSDNSPVDQVNGYHFGEENKLKPGDLVSEKYTAFKL